MAGVPSANLGSTILVPIVCRNGSDVPTTPDADPTYVVYDSTGAAVSGQSGTVTLNPGSKTGFYLLSLTVSSGNNYASNSKYTALVEWQISSSARAAEYVFHVQ